MTTRSPKDIMDEAKGIVAGWNTAGLRNSKDPRTVSRLLALYEERGLDATKFSREAGISVTTMHLWSKGCKTSGKPWQELQAEVAMRRGAALSATIAAEMVPSRPAPEEPKSEPVKPVQDRSGAWDRGGPKDDRRRSAMAEVAELARGKRSLAPTEIVQVLTLYRSTKRAADYFARMVGVDADSLRQWNAGCGVNGREWRALVDAMTMAHVFPSKTARSKAVRRGAVVKPSAPKRAVAVTKWLDAAGNEHGSEHEAEAASYSHDVEVAAEALGAVTGFTVTSPFVLHADKVLTLADAIRAEQAFRASYQTT